jgi:hypothetical protein
MQQSCFCARVRLLFLIFRRNQMRDLSRIYGESLDAAELLLCSVRLLFLILRRNRMRDALSYIWDKMLSRIYRIRTEGYKPNN